MKIIIETIDTCRAKMTLWINSKKYSETRFYDHEECVYRTEGKSISTQMKDDGIDVDGTDLEEYLADVDVNSFIVVAECEDYYTI